MLLSIGLTGILAPPAPAQTVTLEPVGVIPGPVEHVRVQGGYVYLSRFLARMYARFLGGPAMQGLSRAEQN